MMRYLFLLLALAGLFMFPWPYEVALIVIAACFTPLFGLALGIFADALYYTHGLPIGILTGLVAFAIGLLYGYYVKDRITDLSYL